MKNGVPHVASLEGKPSPEFLTELSKLTVGQTSGTRWAAGSASGESRLTRSVAPSSTRGSKRTRSIAPSTAKKKSAKAEKRAGTANSRLTASVPPESSDEEACNPRKKQLLNGWNAKVSEISTTAGPSSLESRLPKRATTGYGVGLVGEKLSPHERRIIRMNPELYRKSRMMDEWTCPECSWHYELEPGCVRTRTSRGVVYGANPVRKARGAHIRNEHPEIAHKFAKNIQDEERQCIAVQLTPELRDSASW